jgi:hypothetical protein
MLHLYTSFFLPSSLAQSPTHSHYLTWFHSSPAIPLPSGQFLLELEVSALRLSCSQELNTTPHGPGCICRCRRVVKLLTVSVPIAILSPTVLIPPHLHKFSVMNKPYCDRYEYRFFKYYLLQADRGCSCSSTSNGVQQLSEFSL